jgi:hypothetical protein
MKRNAASGLFTNPSSLHRAATCGQSRKGEEVAQKKPRDSGENRKEIRKREIIRIGEEEGAWT